MSKIPAIPGQGYSRVRTAKAPVVKVEVTLEEINQATVRDSSHCMIAEAVKVAFPGAKFVSVDLQTIRFSDPNPNRPYRYIYLTPRAAQVALINFDQGIKPEPFHVLIRNGAVVPGYALRQARAAARADSKGLPTKAKATKAAKAASKSLPRRKTIKNRDATKVDHYVPDVVGGSAPPLAALASNVAKGKRRAFGIRALEL